MDIQASFRQEDIHPKDKWIRIIGAPTLSLFIILINKGMDQLQEEFWESWFISLLNTVLLWEALRFLFIQSRKKFPGFEQTRKRLIFLAIICLSVTFTVTTSLDYVFCPLLFDRAPEERSYFIAFRYSILPALSMSIIYESVYFFRSLKRYIHKSEMLARVNAQVQLDVLKKQLDPHFLFNSLNTLASLIEETNEPAQQYLERLSDVYRYVLINREKNTVSLEEEMQFVEAYIYLNKARFRENLQIESPPVGEMHRWQIAPLSLQILVENAIKHNVISKDKPLTIRIEKDQDDYLRVANSLQEKKILEKTTKVGLQNIIERYRLLSNRQVEIIREAGWFAVKIPLIEA